MTRKLFGVILSVMIFVLILSPFTRCDARELIKIGDQNAIEFDVNNCKAIFAESGNVDMKVWGASFNGRNLGTVIFSFRYSTVDSFIYDDNLDESKNRSISCFDGNELIAKAIVHYFWQNKLFPLEIQNKLPKVN